MNERTGTQADDQTAHEPRPTQSSALSPQSWRRVRRFLPPWWTLGFPLLAMAGLAGWRAANAGAGESVFGVFLQSLVWPGAIAFAVVLLFVCLGWNLDID